MMAITYYTYSRSTYTLAVLLRITAERKIQNSDLHQNCYVFSIFIFHYIENVLLAAIVTICQE